MKITKVDIKNFMALGSASLALNDRGLVLIQGENRDDESAKSNGAGKSSITDALSWCLFGSTARGETGDKIINNTAKSAVVAVTLESEGNTYTISRHRKDKKNKNRLLVFQGETDLTLGTDKETQERVNTIIGCDQKVFNAAIYQGQEKIPDLPNFTDKQLKELVEETAGINVLQECYAKAREKRNAASAQCDHAGFELTRVNDAIEKADHDMEIVAEQMNAWGDRQIERIAEKQAEVDEVESERIEAESRLETAEEKREAITKNIAVLEKTLEAKDDLYRKLDKLRDKVNEESEALTIANLNAHRYGEKVDRLQSRLATASDRIGTACGECGKPIEEKDLEAVIDGIKEDIVGVTADYKEAIKDTEKAKAKVEKATVAVTEFEEKIPDYSEATAKLIKCKEIIAKIDGMARTVAVMVNSCKAARHNLEEIEKETNPHAPVLARLSEVRDEAQAELKGAKVAKKAADKELKTMEKAVEVFSPAGVRAHILDHVTPFLNARTSHYLSILSDGNLHANWATLSKTAKGELREKFTIEVENTTGGKSFGLLSGGEKRKVRLACAMALQDIVSQRATKPVDLFMADEIDDALDEAGLERLMAILDEKARERGTVLVISHNNLNDWIREVAVVTKEGGVATISGALDA